LKHKLKRREDGHNHYKNGWNLINKKEIEEATPSYGWNGRK